MLVSELRVGWLAGDYCFPYFDIYLPGGFEAGKNEQGVPYHHILMPVSESESFEQASSDTLLELSCSNLVVLLRLFLQVSNRSQKHFRERFDAYYVAWA